MAWPSSPLNLSVLIAMVCASVGVYLLLWKTRTGYQLRASGASQGAAVYAGITPQRQVLIAMAVSGALAGMVAMNEVSGVHGKLLPDFVAGAGFTGIAVALMGRNHPLGIVLASLLFGMIYQGGAEVAFEVKNFTKDMVVMLQGFIVLFSGAMAYATAPLVAQAVPALCSAIAVLPQLRSPMDSALLLDLLASTLRLATPLIFCA